VLLVGRRQHLGLVDVVDTQSLEDLRLDEMTDPALGHDRDRDRVHDLADELGVGHACDAALGADVGRHALEGHHGNRARVLCNLGLLGGDHVHDDAALEHLGQAALDGPGGGLGSVAVGGRSGGADGLDGHARSSGVYCLDTRTFRVYVRVYG
jgi:hypothetical protein